MDGKRPQSEASDKGADASSRWAEVRATFEHLVELSDEMRRRELAALRERDPELAEEVETLLAHDAEDFLEASPMRLWSSPKTREGMRLGPFTLVRRIGSGGMGEVWEALQDAPARRVAVKILLEHTELGDSRERARFDLEAEVLSRLQHPNIAQIFGAGAERLEDGSELAWIAMELVQNSTDILSWSDREELDLETRLTLFLTLCDAVQHGHQRGVLHRDIKPANVLVSGQPRAPVLKLIDFGIAKLADADGGIGERTRTGEFLGTLAYMAPEQLDTAGVHDVRTDVYSLGVVLYRLLTGKHPIQQEDTDLPKLLRRLATAEATPLSVHQPQLAGDLEWILAKALERDPRSRYTSVEALADDLRRYCGHHPILAGPQSRWCAARKFLRRNRVACTIGAGVAILLVASLVSVTAALFEARKQAQLAQKEVAKNSVVQEMIEALFDGVSPSVKGRDVRVLDLLEDFDAEFDPTQHSAEVEFRLRTVLGGMYHALSSFERAEEQLRAAQKLLGMEGDFDVATRIQAAALLGSTLNYIGSPREGEKFLDSALQLAIEEGRVEAEIDARILRLRQLERSAEFERLLKEAAYVEELANSVGADSALRKSNDYRAVALLGLGRSEEALAAGRESYQRIVESFGADSSKAVRAFVNLAVFINTVHGGAEGEGALLRAVEECERVLGPESSQTRTSYNNYAGALIANGKSEEAERVLERLVALYDAMAAPPVVDRLRTLNNLGMSHRDAGRYAQAEPFLKRTLEEAQRVFPDDDWNLAIFRLNYGSCLAHLGRLEEGEPLLLQAWDVLRLSEDALGVRHKALRTIAKAYELAGRTEEQRFWRQILEQDPEWQVANPGR